MSFSFFTELYDEDICWNKPESYYDYPGKKERLRISRELRQ